jgi:hypothetical protein
MPPAIDPATWRREWPFPSSLRIKTCSLTKRTVVQSPPYFSLGVEPADASTRTLMLETNSPLISLVPDIVRFRGYARTLGCPGFKFSVAF